MKTKKYNLSTIMKCAWKIFRNAKMTFSDALKMAWRNAKTIVNAMIKSEIKEHMKTWYGWTEVGREVIHDSKCVLKVAIEDLKTKSGFRTLCYFTESQTCVLGTQPPK